MENKMTHQMKPVGKRIRHFWDKENKNDMMTLIKMECEKCGHTHEVEAKSGEIVVKQMPSETEVETFYVCR